MDLNIIPAAGLLLLLLFSQPQAAPEPFSLVQLSEATTSENADLTYRSIYDYIRNKFQKTSEEEAQEIARSVVDYSAEHQFDPTLTAAVIAHESGFNRKAISRTGAKGLGQIKDGNFPHLNIQDPFNIQQNVKGTVKYLKAMTDQWKSKSESINLALASYYRGPNAIKRQQGEMDHGSKAYVNNIWKHYQNIVAIQKQYEEEMSK